jgi:transcriptional regulator
MRHTPHYIVTDPDEVKRLIRGNPWATIIATTAKGLVASHYPVMLEEGSDEITLVSHVGRPDDRALELGDGEIMIIIQGPHGYVSPGWYDGGPAVPTWNHVTAHLWGVPEILSDDENWRVLGELVHHFEDGMPHPNLLEHNEEYGRRIMSGTVGIPFRRDPVRGSRQAEPGQTRTRRRVGHRQPCARRSLRESRGGGGDASRARWR